jgi:class 3 adenylate cyclase
MSAHPNEGASPIAGEEERHVVKRVVVTADLAGYTKAFQTKTDEEVGALLDEYICECDQAMCSCSGRIVKFMGDGMLAVAPPEKVDAVIVALIHVERKLDDIAARHGLQLSLGANVHLGPVVEGWFGSGDSRAWDIVGRTVNQTFLMGRGPSLRLSEPAYRQLPSAARSAWSEQKPPAIYHLSSPDGILETLGKSAGTNAKRW